MEDTTITTATEASVEGQTPSSQETSQVVQTTEEPQISAQAQVERSGQQPTSQPAERPKASEYYQNRRKMRSMEDQIKSLTATLTELKKTPQNQPLTEKPKEVSDEEWETGLWKTPRKTITAEVKAAMAELRKEIADLKEKEFPKMLETTQHQQRYSAREQEALERLFPKTETNTHEKLGDRMEADPERMNRIVNFMKENGLNVLYQEDPVKAANIAVKLMDLEKATNQPKNPAVPSKAAMRSTATGATVSSQGGSKMTLKEIQDGLNRLTDRANDNPGLRQDDKWKAERQSLRAKLDQLSKQAE